MSSGFVGCAACRSGGIFLRFEVSLRRAQSLLRRMKTFGAMRFAYCTLRFCLIARSVANAPSIEVANAVNIRITQIGAEIPELEGLLMYLSRLAKKLRYSIPHVKDQLAKRNLKSWKDERCARHAPRMSSIHMM